MLQVNTSLNAAAASTAAANMSLTQSDQRRAKASQTQAAAKDAVNSAKQTKENDGVVDTVQEMFLDVESYREELNKSLEALAQSLSDLDQGITKLESLTIKEKQEDPAILTAREKKDPFEEMFEDLFKELNKYGSDIIDQIQNNVSSERVLSLLGG